MLTILLGAAVAAAGSAALGYWPRWQGRVNEGPSAQLRALEGKGTGRKVAHRGNGAARTNEDAPLAVPPVPPKIAPEARVEASSQIRSSISAPIRRDIHGGASAKAGTPRLRESTLHSSRTADRIAGGEDTSVVLEAMRALRRQHDATRARALLATYLDQHPNGTLAEEALAMSIEAALVQRDGDATALARRYLSRYPAGPFRARARQAITRDAVPEAMHAPAHPR